MRVETKAFYADLFSKPAAVPADDIPHLAPPPLKSRPVAADHAANHAASAAANHAADHAANDAANDAIDRGPGRRLALPKPTPAPAPQAEADPAAAPGASGRPAARPRNLVEELIGDVNLHRLTPRQMANLSSDLYAAGVVSFDDYSALAFQPELQPDFARTIGALTGERAEPDRPRDFVRLWEERTEFQRRHNPARQDIVRQHERIVSVLRRIDAPTDLVA